MRQLVVVGLGLALSYEQFDRMDDDVRYACIGFVIGVLQSFLCLGS
jgi:hypothetical protein